MDNTKKVLILYNKLFHYRIEVFNLLAKHYELTVAHTFDVEDSILQTCMFKTIKLKAISFFNFTIHKNNLFKLCKNYDVVIAYGQVTWLSFSSLVLGKRKFKLIFWGIGLPASYSRHYGDSSYLYNIFSDFFKKKADALLFYSSYPIEVLTLRGYDKNKMFVANNTVNVVPNNYSNQFRNNILFIGTLYKEKGIMILLEAYKLIVQKYQNFYRLSIVGSGLELNEIKNWVVENNLIDKIDFHGAIYNSIDKSLILTKSLMCVSPLQAGLSVLECMGYGVPFVTSKKAITGGEIFNITHGVNGIIMNDVSQIMNILEESYVNKDKYIELGIEAHKYYWSCRKTEDMVQGIVTAIETIN